MPKKPNYNFEKRQREMAKQKKTEEKAQRKAQKGHEDHREEPDSGGEATPDIG